MKQSTARVIRAGASALVLAVILPTGAAAAQASRTTAANGPATVTVTRTPERHLRLDVRDDQVAVRKDVWAGGSLVTVTTPQEQLTIGVEGSRLTVTSPTGSAVVSEDGTRGYDELLAVLQRSRAAARARTLLARVGEGPDTFVGQSLLLTRAILEAGTGTTPALNRQRRWVREKALEQVTTSTRSASGPRVVKTAWQKGGDDRGPGDCWDLYSIEAIRIADDFAECVDDLHWYDAHIYSGCALIYTVRSEAAMFWYIQCSGGFPFSG